MSVEVSEVWFEHQYEGFGIAERSPRVSWRFVGDAKNWQQASYDLEIRRDTRSQVRRITVGRESGGAASSLVPWPDDPLQNRERVEVRVRPHGRCEKESDNEHPLAWSSWTVAEAGLATDGWICKLIRSPLDASGETHRPIMLRRPFSLPESCGKLTRARLYITAHGIYEAEINGKKVGDHVLTPCWTSYRYRLQYSMFDVKELLDSGQNVLGVTVAEGWYCGRLGFLGDTRDIWDSKLGLQAILIASFEDGSETVVRTDEAWNTSFGPLLAAELYDGEAYDARLEQKGWSERGFDDSMWTRVMAEEIQQPERLSLLSSPPIRRIQEVNAQTIKATKHGSSIVDFGQNLVGWVRLKVSGAVSGQKITMKHAEVLEPDGTLSTRPLRTAKATDSFILAGPEPFTYEPRFTFHGFRYVKITGLSGEPPLSAITAIVVHSDMKRTGWFSCSDADLTKFHENTVWGMKGNFVGLPTDCPQRDERLGWTGDIQIFSRSANFLYDTAGLLQNWLRDVDAEQNCDATGIPNCFTPTFMPDSTHKPPFAVWGDVVIMTPWELYDAYGDAEILRKQLDSMTAWLDKGIPRDDHGLWRSAAVDQLGDWLDPAAPPNEPGLSRTDANFVANAYLVHVTELMAKIQEVLGNHEENKRYKCQAAVIRKHFQDEYITPRGRVVCDTETAIALAIHFSLFENEAQMAVAASRLEELVRGDSRFKVATGFVGTPILGLAMTKVNQTQLFYRMLLHKQCPSWLYPITMGATTVWERWDSMLPDGSINPGEMTSFNHYALGATVQWLHAHMAGLSPSVPGWKRFAVAPQPGGPITWVSAKYISPYGTISVDWKIEAGIFELTVSVPPSSNADVTMPGSDNVVQVGSGTYVFRADYITPADWPPKPMYRPFMQHDGQDT